MVDIKINKVIIFMVDIKINKLPYLPYPCTTQTRAVHADQWSIVARAGYDAAGVTGPKYSLPMTPPPGVCEGDVV